MIDYFIISIKRDPAQRDLFFLRLALIWNNDRFLGREAFRKIL